MILAFHFIYFLQYFSVYIFVNKNILHSAAAFQLFEIFCINLQYLGCTFNFLADWYQCFYPLLSLEGIWCSHLPDELHKGKTVSGILFAAVFNTLLFMSGY